ncbi:hypothetical protein [Echinicola shivajiensis]|nr:hypothetical protein [Echinicola shivajiensis]
MKQKLRRLWILVNAPIAIAKNVTVSIVWRAIALVKNAIVKNVVVVNPK